MELEEKQMEKGKGEEEKERGLRQRLATGILPLVSSHVPRIRLDDVNIDGEGKEGETARGEKAEE